MALSCVDLLSEDFSSLSFDCSAIPILAENIENLAQAVCDMQCEVGHIGTTDDCSILPEDFFPSLFPACIELPSNAVVIQSCPCSSGGVKIWVWDENESVWRRLGKEFAVGNTGDFVDPNSPTDSELTALFGDGIANEAMVVIRPTRETWITENCGISWFLLLEIPPIGADVQNTTWNTFYTQSGSHSDYIEYFDEELYTTGSSSSFPIAVGDIVDITVVYGYEIVEFDGANPVDDVRFRFRISGICTLFDTDYGSTDAGEPEMLIKDGMQYAEFSIKIRATIAGNLRLQIFQTAGGNNDPDEWEWQFNVIRSSTSVMRA